MFEILQDKINELADKFSESLKNAKPTAPTAQQNDNIGVTDLVLQKKQDELAISPKKQKDEKEETIPKGKQEYQVKPPTHELKKMDRKAERDEINRYKKWQQADERVATANANEEIRESKRNPFKAGF